MQKRHTFSKSVGIPRASLLGSPSDYGKSMQQKARIAYESIQSLRTENYAQTSHLSHHTSQTTMMPPPPLLLHTLLKAPNNNNNSSTHRHNKIILPGLRCRLQLRHHKLKADRLLFLARNNISQRRPSTSTSSSSTNHDAF
jgi:hypothetical protein